MILLKSPVSEPVFLKEAGRRKIKLRPSYDSFTFYHKAALFSSVCGINF